MASAQSFLVNENPRQDTRMLDMFVDPQIFANQLFKNNGLLLQNSTQIPVDARYNLRPDLLSFELYGTNFYYPAILAVNKLGSIFQFKAEYLNNKCLVPSIDVLETILQKANVDLQQKLLNIREKGEINE